MEGYVVAKVSLNCSRCTFKTAKLKKWKAKRRLSTHNRNDYPPIDMAYNGVAHTENYQEIVQQESIEIVSPSTKVSLQCDICTFRTALLKRSKAQQRLYSHRYSHILNIDRFQYSVQEMVEVGENTDKEPAYIIVTGDEPWMANYGLMKGEILWEGEDLSNVTASKWRNISFKPGHSHSYSKHIQQWDRTWGHSCRGDGC